MKIPFPEVFVDETKNGTKLKTSDYQTSGTYPIIDQGQDFIAGYTDSENGLYTDVPAIIFGDHTRVLKYIDFPFFLGADGAKILKARKAHSNYRYLYYALKSVRIPDTGYNRHFKWLKEATVSILDSQKQESIVFTLDSISRIISHRKSQLAKLDELVKCRFVELFGDAKNNPYGWVSETVDSVTEEIIGGISVSGESRKIQKGELAVLKVSAVTYGVFKCDEYKVISNDIKLGKYVSPKKGDLLFSRANTKELVGATALVDKDYPHLLLPDKIWKIVVSDKVSPVYLKAYLSEPWIRELMSKVATGTSGSMYNISMEKLRQIPVILPPIERQNAFASFVSRIDKLRFFGKAEIIYGNE